MIQAKELRIGNWVYSQMIDGPFQISNLTTDYDPLCKPIPLTEEILLKCGFEKQDYNMSNCHVYQKGSYRVLKSFNDNNINQDYSLCINGISPPTWSIAHFKFVHQFQNIIHALTSTELEINL